MSAVELIGVRVADERDRAGVRRRRATALSACRSIHLPHHRIVRADDAARAREQPLAARRRERDPREAIVDRAGRDRRVVVDAPQLVDERRRRDDPADPQTGQAVGLRQPARDDRALVAAPDARRARRRRAPRRGRSRRTSTHAPRTAARSGRCRRAPSAVSRAPGRVVRVADQDQPGASA